MKNKKTKKTKRNKIKPEYVDLRLHIDNNLAFIGVSQFTDGNYIVLSDAKQNFTWTCSLDYAICRDGYIVRSVNKNGLFNVYRHKTKETSELTFEKFINLFAGVVEISEDDEYEDEDDLEEEEDDLDE